MMAEDFVMKDGCIEGGVGTYSPMVVKTKDGYSGSCIVLIDMIMKKLGFCYNLRSSPNGLWGYEYPNGSWNGLIGLAQRSEIEFITCPLGVTYSRYRAIDFTQYVITSEYSIIYPRPKIEANYSGFVLPFSLQSWLAIALMVLAISALSSMAQIFVSLGYARSNNAFTQVLTKNFNPMSKSWVFVSLISQPLTKIPNGNSGRLLVMFWMLLGLIISMTYKSSLKARLIAPQIKVPFNNLGELVNQDVYKWSFLKGAFLRQIFEPAYKKDPNSILGLTWERKGELFLDNSEIQSFVIDKNYACLDGIPTIMNIMDKDFSETGKCNTAITREGFIRVDATIGVRKKSNLTKLVNPIIDRLKETGIMNLLMNPTTLNSTFCKASPGSEVIIQTRILTFKDFIGILSILLIGLTLSFIVLLIEILTFHLSSDRY